LPEGRFHKPKNATGAEVLVAYAIRNNVQDLQDAIETVADSRDLLEKGQLSGDAQKKANLYGRTQR
jgi:hypothetical protein